MLFVFSLKDVSRAQLFVLCEYILGYKIQNPFCFIATPMSHLQEEDSDNEVDLSKYDLVEDSGEEDNVDLKNTSEYHVTTVYTVHAY